MYTSLEDFLARAEAKLDPLTGQETLPEGGDFDFLDLDRTDLRAAAVLIPIIRRPGGPTMLLTKRPQTMASHPGQVAFPGGKIESHDENEVAAALREAEEEVGVRTDQVQLIARAAPYVTGTAYRVTPVLGVLPEDFVARPDPSEVDDVFETPLEYVMTAANHQRKTIMWEGRTRRYIEMPWQGFRIWGVTAGIIRELYKAVYEAEA